MQKIDLYDTIAAISTPVGESGIGIVRMSGKDALSVADRIFVSKDGKRASSFKTYTVHYGWVIKSPQSAVSATNRVDRGPSTEIVDEVLLTVMRAPKSYTKEDIVEISCHGGIVALRGVLELVLENGCRLAQGGEFTKRAFLNGRIDLAQAEAVLDVIKSKTDSALRVSVEQLKGVLSGEINKIRDGLLDILSHIEAGIDFPDEDIETADLGNFLGRIKIIDNDLRLILNSAARGRILREGISVVICGKPNAGKSSLLNALLKQERAIVTPIAGTTRDIIEEIIDIKGIPVRIADTAGILKPRGLIEKKAVGRSKKYIKSADLVLLLLDNSRPMDRYDELLMRKLKKKTTIAVINKMDLKPKIKKELVLKKFSYVVYVSAKKMQNLQLLEEVIAECIYQGKIKDPESVFVSNLRHIELLKKAEKLVAEAANSLDNKRLSLEFAAQDIKDSLGYIDELLGSKFSEDLLNKIFSEFCIGK